MAQFWPLRNPPSPLFPPPRFRQYFCRLVEQKQAVFCCRFAFYPLLLSSHPHIPLSPLTSPLSTSLPPPPMVEVLGSTSSLPFPWHDQKVCRLTGRHHPCRLIRFLWHDQKAVRGSCSRHWKRGSRTEVGNMFFMDSWRAIRPDVGRQHRSDRPPSAISEPWAKASVRWVMVAAGCNCTCGR